MSYDFVLSKGSSLSVDHQIIPDDASPSLRPHYWASSLLWNAPPLCFACRYLFLQICCLRLSRAQSAACVLHSALALYESSIDCAGTPLSQQLPDLILNAFRMGVQHQGCAPLVVHSDRGSQYASDLFRAELDQLDCIQSMSRKEAAFLHAASFVCILATGSRVPCKNLYQARAASMPDAIWTVNRLPPD